MTTPGPTTETLPHGRVAAAVDRRHWRVVLGTLRAVLVAPDFATGAELVQQVAEAAEAAGHHPDVLLRWGSVTITLVSHDAGGLTARDVALARTVSALADRLGMTGAPERVQAVELAVDALDRPGVRPFWAAVLGYADHPGDGGLVGPTGEGPTVWFQQMDSPRPQRNRLHVDVSVGEDEAPRRVAAALAAGGRLVSDAEAPAFWVLADAEGNEACVCTWQGRPTA
ncbi:VOC family protein [Cellulomonas endophytica]|uniref:VOC family protein n=1 Tax=Cellulomonas endophytica TaxID=2494735 RepID=UPI0010105090|nr:VOC family protein [Cellulomonas endophytica]